MEGQPPKRRGGATAPWRQRDKFQSRQRRRNYWIVQSEPGSIAFVGCPIVVAGSFHLALRMRNEWRSVGESKLDLGPVTHRVDRRNPCAGVVMMALVMEKIRVRLGNRGLGLRYVIPIVVGLVGAVGLLLAVLHGIEAAIWAAAYLWLGALGSPIDAILYSVDSMTTRGASGLTLQRHWRMMGALEAGDGMLLFGISTAYIFAVMQVYWPMLSRRAQRDQPAAAKPD